MSNIIRYKDRIVAHPGYYVEEDVEASGLSQEDYARRLGTTPKNLSMLIQGKQSLSADMAVKLGRMYNTGTEGWLNLQKTYDLFLAEIKADEESQREKGILRILNCKDLTEKLGIHENSGEQEQLSALRSYLKISSLNVLKDVDLSVRFKNEKKELNEKETVLSNILVIAATNKALETEAKKYDRKKFLKALKKIKPGVDREEIIHILSDCGAVLVVMPELEGSKTLGAVKILKGKVMMMICDKGQSEEEFFDTLYHEAGHILHGENKIFFEEDAEAFAKKRLTVAP